MAPDASVVIPAYNAEAFIGQCMAALAAQTMPREAFEVVIIDDGSKDATLAMCERLKTELGLGNLTLHHQPNAGPASARNRGVRLAKAEIVAFLDSDCIPRPDWLETLIRPLREKPALQGVEGQTVPVPGETSPLHHYVENRQGGQYWTCNMAYRKSALLSVGGFDEGFPLPSGEDIDLAYRVKRLGEIAFESRAMVEHVLVYRPMGWHFRYARTFSSMIRLWRKHPGLLLPPDTRFSTLVVFQLKQLIFPWLRESRTLLFKDPLAWGQMGLIRCVCAIDTLLRLPRYYAEAHGPLVVQEPLQ